MSDLLRVHFLFTGMLVRRLVKELTGTQPDLGFRKQTWFLLFPAYSHRLF